MLSPPKMRLLSPPLLQKRFRPLNLAKMLSMPQLRLRLMWQTKNHHWSPPSKYSGFGRERQRRPMCPHYHHHRHRRPVRRQRNH